MPDAADDLVTWTLADGVGRITMDRPERKNALTGGMRDRVRTLLEQADADLRVRALLLTGAGGDFCAGADLSGGRDERPPRPEQAPDRAMGDVARMLRRGWQRLVAAVQDCGKPVVAAVEGVAAGGGMHLAVACDLVVAAEDARFVSAFVRRGILPDAGGAYLLTRLVGPQVAKRLMLFGEEVSGAEAAELGLVARTTAGGGAVAAAEEWAGRLADGPTKALGATKQLVNRALEVDRETSLREEAWLQERITDTADAREGLGAFAEGRDPEFRGW